MLQSLQRRMRRNDLNRATIESIESRLYLSGHSAKVPAYTDPIVHLASEQATPEGSSSPGSTPLTPATIRGAYGLGTVGSSNITFGSVQGDGTGQTIAILAGGNDPTIASDLASFDSYYSLPAPPTFQVLNQSGGTDLSGVPTQNSGETALDVEWSHVVAPEANIILYASDSIYTALTTAKSTAGVSVISISYNISGSQTDSFYRTPAGHAGVTVLGASGDSAGTVDQPGASNSVISVGGTFLTLSGNGGYGTETTWDDAGSGLNTADSQPSYQAVKAAPYTTQYRATPDVSIDASPYSGVAVYDTTGNASATPWTDYVGGTSLATPLWAGIIAVADQGRADAGLTSMDGYSQTLPRLYELPSSAFNDITTGSNAYPAEPGYDLATGLGTPVANVLIPDLAGADTITGTAFVDANHDSVYDSGDSVLANQTVYLDLYGNGIQEPTDPTATTNSSGVYSFTDQLGGLSGEVRLATAPNGDPYRSTDTTFTTSYDKTQTENLGYSATNFGPTISTAAKASPSPVTGETAALTVAAKDDAHGTSGLTYTWAATAIPGEAENPTFSVNGTNAANSTTATFTKAGTYTFTVTATDSAGLVAVSNVSVTVNQTLTSIQASPASVNLTAGQTKQFSIVGFDQFGNTTTSTPTATWTLTSGGGSISSAGLYTSPSTGTMATVTATYGSLSASAAVYVVSAPWTSVDVGAPALSGSAFDSGSGYPGDTFTLTGAGVDVYGDSDQFHYVYQTLTGNGTILARVASQQDTAPAAKAGVDIRASTATGAVHVAIDIRAGEGPEFLYRTTTGGSTSADLGSSSIEAPYYVKLARVGDVFTGSVSPDGINWTVIGSATVAMSDPVDIGLLDGSVNSSELSTDVFDHVAVSPTVASAVVGSPNPVTGNSTTLTALGADTYGESNLAYSWAATSVPAGAKLPTYTANGTNAAKTTTTTFYAAGSYRFTVTITDAAGLTSSSSVTVNVTQQATSIQVAPLASSVVPGGTEYLFATVLDQFGNIVASPGTVTFAVNGSGNSIASTGATTATLTAGETVGTYGISATLGGVIGTASVIVAVPPQVNGVVLASSSWSSSFLSAITAAGYGSSAASGFAVPGGSAQTTTLPWNNLNTISITFSQNVNVTQAALALDGVLRASYGISGFSYNATTFTATWTLAAPISAADRLLIKLASSGANAVTSAATGLALDGEWSNASSAFPSGNGQPGGDFDFQFNVLPGDANRSGGVNIVDTTYVSSLQATSPTSPLYSLFADVNGSGGINVVDTTYVSSKQATTLPSGQPA